MIYVIAKPLEGCSLNGDTFLCDDANETLEFKTQEEAEKYLKAAFAVEGLIGDDAEEFKESQGIYIKEIPDGSE